MKKIICLLLAFVIAFGNVPMEANAEEIKEDELQQALYLIPEGLPDIDFLAPNTAYTVPETVTAEEAKARLLDFAEKFEGKFFTVSGNYCSASGIHATACSNCLMSNVIAAEWVEELVGMGTLNASLCPTQYSYRGTQGSADGYQCFGFANFAHWYIFAGKNTDKVTSTLELTGPMTLETIIKALPGDVIRSNYYSGHSMVFISCDEEGFTVLDSNHTGNADGKSACIVKVHKVKYNAKYTVAITGVENYDRKSATEYFLVKYDANGGTNAPKTQIKTEDINLVLTSDLPEFKGRDFLGWAKTADAEIPEFAPGAEYSENADITLYAVWSECQHEYDSVITEPTCTEQGYTTYTCKFCGNSYVDTYTEPIGHSFGEWETVTEATFTEDGTESRTCVKCSHVEYRSIPLTVITSGNFGYGTEPTDKVIYTLYSNGTMIVEGEGKTFYCNYNADHQPFIEYRKQVKHLIIGEGITAIERGNFAYFSNLETVSFPDTLKEIAGNAFMFSFVPSVSSITIPKSVGKIGVAAFGGNSGNTFFTDIVIENPDINFPDKSNSFYHAVFNYGRKPEMVTLYSYGAENNVSAYAKDVGYNYIDLNNYRTGEFGGIKYEFYNGVLTLSTESEGLSIPAENAPWNEYKNEITKIEIESGISGISENAFANYPVLNEVELPDDFKSIGDGAFILESGEGTVLKIRIPKRIKHLGENIFEGRETVDATVYYGSIAENFNEPNVNLIFKKQFKMLMMGNSFTNDAANRSQGMKDSQLFNMMQAILGEDAEITLGAITSGGKTMSWHATKAEENAKDYSFGIVTSEDGLWKSMGSASSAEAFEWTDWDVISFQPHQVNVSTGKEIVPYPEETAEKFYSLETACEYMLEHAAKYAPYAEIYCYMHWATTSSIVYDAGIGTYNGFAEFYPTVLDYKGTESGKQFENIVPVGLSIQNARTTYLALLNYNKGEDVTLESDPQVGLMREGTHTSFNIGRYIAGLTFAEMVIPEEMREEGYKLPDIRITESVGKLPKEYTEIAQKSVFAAVESWKNGSLAVTEIEGYKVDPVDTESAKLAESKIGVSYAADVESFKARISEAVLEALPEDFAIESVALSEDFEITGEGQEFEAEIEIRFGYMFKKVTVSFAVEKALIGDINLDGSVNVMDAYYARLVAAKLIVPTEQQLLVGDVDLDGKITAIDANIIRKYIAGIITELPVEA